MKQLAFVFPGQGAQAVGMGQDLASTSPEAARVFEIFDTEASASNRPLSQICFDGPAEDLQQTRVTQPAILATSLAALAAFQAKAPDVKPALTAGHSLGEYGALVAAGVIDVPTAARLIKERARLMNDAPEGAMAVVLGGNENQLDKLMLEIKTSQPEAALVIANFNSADQHVISGSKSAVEAAVAKIQEDRLAKRVLPLPVSGAFHSPLMDAPANAFKQALANEQFHDARCPVITNVDALPTTEAETFRRKLSEQINGSVRWQQTMQAMVNDHVIDTIIEFGPGKVLTGLMRKAYPEVRVFNVQDADSLAVTLTELGSPIASSLSG